MKILARHAKKIVLTLSDLPTFSCEADPVMLATDPMIRDYMLKTLTDAFQEAVKPVLDEFFDV